MASHCYLIGHSGEMLVEFLVRHCGLSDQEMVESKSSNAHYSFLPKKSEVRLMLVIVKQRGKTISHLFCLGFLSMMNILKQECRNCFNMITYFP